MSDVMLFGVLGMPFDMAMADELSRRQFYSRAQEAVRRIKDLEAEVARLQALTGDIVAEDGLPADAGEVAEPVLWHAPGMGEVHSHNHELMIDCMKSVDDPAQDFVADDILAKKVCSALNAFERQPSASGPVVAWMTEDGGRVVSAATKGGLKTDGGASATAMRAYCVPLGRLPEEFANPDLAAASE